MKQLQKTHVLYIITKLELGGAQKVCLTLFKDFQSHPQVEASLLSGAEGVLVNEVHNAQNIYLLKSLKREVGFKSFMSEFRAFKQIYKIIKSMKEQHPNLIVHTHSTKAGIVGRWAAFFARVKKRVHTVHGYGFHDHQNKIVWFVLYFLELMTSFITTQYICVSSKDQQTGMRLFPRFAKKSLLIRAAVDYETFYIPAQRAHTKIHHNDSFIFGTVSCFKPQKNLIDLFRAFKLMHDELSLADQNKIKLEVIGDGIQRLSLEKWITEHGLEKKIVLLGWQSNVAEHMHRWSAFVMSSLWEGLPCAIIEARLSRLPVIAYNVGGIAEVVINTKNGFLVQPGDWHVLGKKMKAIYCDDSLYRSMGEFADGLAEFNNQEMVKKHANLYSIL